jgi:APA family basic amino acid/polyamine antiporter
VVVIGIGAVLAAALVLPTDLEFLAGIYAFGATLAFTIVHVGILALRWREPDRDRPYKIPFNVRVGPAELPVPAIVGALVSFAAFLSVIVLHSGARIVGLVWMAFGVTMYVYYRIADDKPIFRRVTVPEGSLTGEDLDISYARILVPILGTPLDDDIMQTAGRLAGLEAEEEWEGGYANIEAVWVYEVPLSLPLDARLPDELVQRARAALARAKAVGQEYEGVVVHTSTARARKLGEGVVTEARRKGVEAIVLAAEEPTRMRGGLTYGGKIGLRDTFVGESTRYVVAKAHCRVILTAPPSDPGEGRDILAGAPVGEPVPATGDLG